VNSFPSHTASILIDRADAAFRSAGLHTQAGENPELRSLFFKFCQLLRAPVTLVFVFDGPDRPPKKRGHLVVDNELWLIGYVKQLIEAFGFYYHEVHFECIVTSLSF
jgi:hypothetical protein